MSKIVYITNLRTSMVDDTCARRLWFERFEKGTGARLKSEVIPDAILQETHRDLRTLQFMKDEDLTVSDLKAMVQSILSGLTHTDLANIPNMECLYRRLGWLVSYAIFVEPFLRRTQESLLLPEELILDREPLHIAVTPGRLLQDKATRKVIYRTYVPTWNVSHNWRESWKYAIHPQVELAAVAEALNVNIDAFQVVGLYKGFVSRGSTQDRLSHAYVQAYHNTVTDEWTHNYLVGRGEEWEETYVWNYPGGLVDWVVKCGRDVAERQFPLTTPTPANPGMLQDWVQRRLGRERLMASASPLSQTNEYHRGQNFPRNTTSCTPVHGERCAFLSTCWDDEILKSPLASPEFVPGEWWEGLGRHEVEHEVSSELYCC